MTRRGTMRATVLSGCIWILALLAERKKYGFHGHVCIIIILRYEGRFVPQRCLATHVPVRGATLIRQVLL